MAKQSFQILTARLLDRELGLLPSQHRDKSGIGPPVRTVTKNQLQDPGDRPVETFRINLAGNLKESHPLKQLIYFMEATGCRISEAINLKPTDITSTGLVKLKSLKGSEKRMLHSGKSMEYLLTCKKRNHIDWNEWTRQFVYREFKKLGIGQQFGNSKTKSVTHYFRHIIAKSIKNEDMSMTDTKKFLGHKSIKSTARYHE
jgi:site-specific recombinase XerD